MQAIEKRITKEVFAVLSVESPVMSWVSDGGTAPKNVQRGQNRWLKTLAKERPGRRQAVKFRPMRGTAAPKTRRFGGRVWPGYQAGPGRLW